MHVIRQGISQIKTPYNFSRIDSDTHKPDDLKMTAEFLKKETKSLSSSAIKIALDLFKILLHIKKLPILPPIRDANLLKNNFFKRIWHPFWNAGSYWNCVIFSCRVHYFLFANFGKGRTVN